MTSEPHDQSTSSVLDEQTVFASGRDRQPQGFILFCKGKSQYRSHLVFKDSEHLTHRHSVVGVVGQRQQHEQCVPKEFASVILISAPKYKKLNRRFSSLYPALRCEGVVTILFCL